MLTDYTVSALVTDDGRLELDNRGEFSKAMRTFKRGRVTVRVEIDRPKRSNRANRYYFGAVLKLIAEHTGDEPLDLHESLKRKFTQPIVLDVLGEQILVWRTSDDDSQEFYDFVEAVRHFAVTELGVETPDPDPHFKSRRERTAA